jgi:hypothetical protein
MRFDPPPLPPNGHLLTELGYLEEPLAAIALDLALQTLVEYRKKQVGPDYTVVGRTILYSRDNLQKWLAAGGTRAFIENDTAPAPKQPAPPRAVLKPKQPVARAREPSTERKLVRA